MNKIPQKYRQARLDELVPHPRNPNRGDIGAIHTSITTTGWYGAIIVQKATGYILAGNHRVEAARHANANTVPIIELDCDDQTATRILLTDNRTASLADTDNDVLLDLLRELNADNALHGTGYDTDDLDALLTEAAEPFNAEPDQQHNAQHAPTRCPDCGFEWRTGPKGEIEPV